MLMQRMYMVRHGQSKDNAHKIVSGTHETPLSELGKEQARAAGRHARGLAIDLIVASPLERAQHTARIIAEETGYPATDIVTIPEFSERDLGKLEGTSYAQNPRLNGNFPAVEHIVGVEKLPHFNHRVEHGLRQLLHDKQHKTILIVCHVGVGRMLRVVTAGKKPLELYDQPKLENGVIYPLL
jgi:ribonuclease H / adenosylcobalamin/alpha-ribazole phosphatase